MSIPETYILNSNKLLGSGLTAKVYLGIRASDGRPFALKCSLKKGYQGIYSNEETIMRGLNHESIVKFYESISNFERFDRVLVMEYCNRGSLYDFAELHQGLCDNLFLRVLECLYQGILYLRSKDLLHRDIKPGNMMVHQDNMGHYYVKLGDMGTTKQVAEGETFKTLVGTLEYLHPDMFIDFIEELQGTFNVSVDLWSTGVTLYHAATSQLPFRPYRYARASFLSRTTLNNMYRNKKPGVISGVQNSQSPDDISYSDKLPTTCRLSPMLNNLASRLIGTLMDLNENNTYERFFANAKELLLMKRILIFNSLNGELLILYLPNLSYNVVIDSISEAVHLPKEDLIILTRNKVLKPLSDPTVECLRSMPVKGHLRYTLTDDTVLLVVKNSPQSMHNLISKKQSLTECSRPEKRYAECCLAKKYSTNLLKLIYNIGYNANYIDCQFDCYLATMFSFNQYVLVDDVRLVNEALSWRTLATRNSCAMANELHGLALDIIDNIKSYKDTYAGLTKYKADITRLEQDAKDNETDVNQYYKIIVEGGEMFKYTEENFYKKNDPVLNDNLDFLVHLSEELVNEMMVIPEDKSFKEDKTYKLEFWQRHVRLFNYYNDAKKRFNAKSQRILEVNTYFGRALNQGLIIMTQVAGWGNALRTMESNRVNITSQFMELARWWRGISVNNVAPEGETLKSRIIEIQNLLNALMEAEK